VLGADDAREYLRFDLFAVAPHYHYFDATAQGHEAGDRRFMLDTDAEGDAVTWTITKLRDRLGVMLAAAGGAALVEQLDPEVVRGAVDQVAALLVPA
jgi:hypothetical protein